MIVVVGGGGVVVVAAAAADDDDDDDALAVSVTNKTLQDRSLLSCGYCTINGSLYYCNVRLQWLLLLAAATMNESHVGLVQYCSIHWMRRHGEEYSKYSNVTTLTACRPALILSLARTVRLATVHHQLCSV